MLLQIFAMGALVVQYIGNIPFHEAQKTDVFVGLGLYKWDLAFPFLFISIAVCLAAALVVHWVCSVSDRVRCRAECTGA